MQVREAMSNNVKMVHPSHSIRAAAQLMAMSDCGCLPVVDRAKRLVGILSLGDIALTENMASAGMALCGISEPGGEHSQLDGQGMMRGA